MSEVSTAAIVELLNRLISDMSLNKPSDLSMCATEQRLLQSSLSEIARGCVYKKRRRRFARIARTWRRLELGAAGILKLLSAPHRLATAGSVGIL